MSGVFTIPSDLCFVTTLAEGLWRRGGGDPLALASYTLYLPTRRSCRHLRDAFLRASGGKASLLPRLKPLGDIDETEMDFAESGELDGLPPAIPPLRRQMLLMQLILKKDKTLPLDQAASLAASLASLLDQAQIEERDFAALENLVPAEYAAHWQETLRFLEIVTKLWPKLLEKEGCLDPAQRRRLVLDAQAAQWQAVPPPGPVIAAGSTGSAPAAGRLMNVIAGLPLGEVILPGLDLELEEEAWQVLDDTHPQATMKNWLELSKIKRADVTLWEGASSHNPARVKWLREALRPAEVTESWRHLTPNELPENASAGLERLDLDHAREEADVIALRLRAALEEQGCTAALVTPDRSLAARVVAALGRWGIEVNDSAGSPLSNWPVGGFLNELLAAASPDASPVAYLSLLKHPLTAAGVEPQTCRQYARLAEMKVWRGVRRAGGLAGVAREMKGDFFTFLAKTFASFTENWNKPQSIADHLAAHIALAEAVAATPDTDGATRLWRGDDGQAAAQWLNEWRAASAGFPSLTGAAYARIFAALMKNVAVRPSYGSHPRLSLLGPLEARLLHYDLVILGGLNEGVWPPAPPVDSWMSRPMKRDFGLPSPERRVGLSAHDFVELACVKQVLLTRSRRIGATPSVPSRFLLQMETVLKAAGHESALMPKNPWAAWAAALDAPDGFSPMDKPEPKPPLEARPRRLSVTEIGTWLRNPYAIYAKHILKLKKLEDIDADVTAAEYGNVVHEALEKFVEQTREIWPAEPLMALLEEGRRAFSLYADRPQVKAFWWPRFERLALWFIENEENRRAEGIAPWAAEEKGEMALAFSFILTGRADRIDLLPEGGAEIIDYKTGNVPSKKQVLSGFEPQLSLLAAMTAQGAFRGKKLKAVKLSYWKLQGGEEIAKETAFTENLEEHMAKAQEGLEALVHDFTDPRMPYRVIPRPDFAPGYDDYAHLARIKEWGRERGG